MTILGWSISVHPRVDEPKRSLSTRRRNEALSNGVITITHFHFFLVSFVNIAKIFQSTRPMNKLFDHFIILSMYDVGPVCRKHHLSRVYPNVLRKLRNWLNSAADKVTHLIFLGFGCGNHFAEKASKQKRNVDVLSRGLLTTKFHEKQ